MRWRLCLPLFLFTTSAIKSRGTSPASSPERLWVPTGPVVGSLLGFTVPHPPPQCTTKAKGNLNHKEVISFLLPSPLFQPDRGNGILASQQQAISLCYLNQSAIIKFFMKLPRPSVFIKAALKHFLLETKEKNYLY